jgi:hypothetical protein
LEDRGRIASTARTEGGNRAHRTPVRRSAENGALRVPRALFRFMESFVIFQLKVLGSGFRVVYDTQNKSRYLKYFRPYLSNVFMLDLAQHRLSCCLLSSGTQEKNNRIKEY